jgi:glycerol-1-phosphate dehydrogenase [NAD(P)+]
MPLLARMVATPLVIDVRRGATKDLPEILADQRISARGRVAIAYGSSCDDVVEGLRERLPVADCFRVDAATVDGAMELAEAIKRSSYDAVVGIGGGRVLDTTKYAAARLGLPMVAVATNLAHDGIASPVSILDQAGHRGSYGVPPPIGVVIDLDQVRRGPVRFVRAGLGDAVSNLSAIADWELSRDVTGEPIDGLAVALARTAAEAVLNRQDDVASDEFLVALAEALVLSGIAMAVSGTSRSCSGACHEISHAIDALFPDKAASHGEQVGLGAAFAYHLRQDHERTDQIITFLRRHGLPVRPADIGLELDEFAAAVDFAPQTRPGRFTILEHLDLTPEQVREQVHGYVAALDR